MLQPATMSSTLLSVSDNAREVFARVRAVMPQQPQPQTPADSTTSTAPIATACDEEARNRRRRLWQSGLLSIGIMGLVHAGIELPIGAPVSAAITQTQVNGRHFSENLVELYKRRALYRSLPASVVGSVPKSIAHYYFFSLFGEHLLPDGDVTKATPRQAALCGMATGAAEAATTTPLNFVRARMQRPEWGYTGTADCVRTVLKQEGPLAFYKGLAPLLVRNPLCSGVMWYTLKSLDSKLPDFTGKWFVTGAAGGILGSLVSYPFELWRAARMQDFSLNRDMLKARRLFRGWAPGATQLTFSSALMALMAPNLKPLKDYLDAATHA